jgi:hypothetical protein
MHNRHNKYYQIHFLIVFIFYTLISCNTTEPPPPNEKPTLELTFEDVSCSEAWITLTTTNLQLPKTVTLKQNDQTRSTINLVNTVTLFYIDSLLPNQTYTFQSVIQSINQSSNELSVTTMDTTSHNFTFETFTFGGTAGSSTLSDVAIINENNIWAVGEISIADTSQNGYTTYNAVHWDGSQWELMRIPFLFQGDSFYNPIYAVFAFSADDIWFGIGNLIHWDGTSYFPIGISSVFQSLVNKIWGSSGSNLYVVGNNGNIAYCNGVVWNRIESGTEVNINDVYGLTDEMNNRKKVFCAASFVLQLGDHKILTIDENNNVDSLHWNTGRRVNSTWSNNGWIVYTSGGGVFNNKSGRWREETSIPLYYTNRIRGNGLNDIFVAGDFGLMAHFNGVQWKVYDEFLYVASSLSISVNGDKIAAVGRQGEKALIILGKRI